MDYEDLEKFFSKERMKKYLVMANNDKEKAVKLYECNLKMSCQLYFVLSCFETFLRNRINDEMKNYNNNWILNLYSINNKIVLNLSKTYHSNNKTISYYKKFFDIQNNLIQNAKSSLLEDKKPITNDYLVSRLNFGFWTRLFSKVYNVELWNRYLYIIFKNSNGIRNTIEDNLNEIRRLRNRIAHNECVLNLKHIPVEYYDFMIDFIKKIDVKTAVWIENQMSRDLFIL